MTQRDIARAAGVSRPAVSLALRNHPGIPPETRDRIRKLAETMGYVPDPMLSVLASYRWPASSAQRSVVSIGLIELRHPREADLEGYPGVVRRGVLNRAMSLGYAVTVFNLPEYDGNLKHLLHVMRSRGITGIVLLPIGRPVSLDPTVGWDSFSVVSATTSVLAPRFHRVVPNQLYNMKRLVEKLQRAGYRRIGAIFGEGYDERTTHAYSMALSWFGQRDNILILADDSSVAENNRRVRTWLRTRNLEIVFVPDVEGARQLSSLNAAQRRTRRGVRLVTPGSFIEQYPELIGETAVRLLTGMMQHHETGIPEHPQITTIDGTVREHLIPPCEP